MLGNILNFIISFSKDFPIYLQIILTIVGFIVLGFSTYIATILQEGDKIEYVNVKENMHLKPWFLMGIIASIGCFAKLFPLGVICFIFIVSVQIIQMSWYLCFNKFNPNAYTERKEKDNEKETLNIKLEKQNDSLTEDAINKLLNGEISIEDAIDFIAENDPEIENQIQNNTFSEMIKDSHKLEQVFKKMISK